MNATSPVRFACQTYSWQMSGRRYRGRIDRIAAVAADAGFTGLEPELFMLGRKFQDEALLASALSASRLELAAIAYAGTWRDPTESEAERAEADAVIELARAFPGAKLVLVQLPGKDRSNLAERQRHAIACMNAVARRAAAIGVRPTVHPNSPRGSLFRTADDYAVLFDGLDEEIGFTPDVGHVAAGGMDALEPVMRYRDRLDHVHFKDIYGDGTWAPTGQGRLDLRGIVSYLASTAYEGWIVFEDESEDARRDPGEATRRNAVYAREVLLPLLGSGALHQGST